MLKRANKIFPLQVIVKGNGTISRVQRWQRWEPQGMWEEKRKQTELQKLCWRLHQPAGTGLGAELARILGLAGAHPGEKSWKPSIGGTDRSCPTVSRLSLAAHHPCIDLCAHGKHGAMSGVHSSTRWGAGCKSAAWSAPGGVHPGPVRPEATKARTYVLGKCRLC